MMIQFLSALGNDALLTILQQSGDPMAIYTGEDLCLQFANNAMLKIWNKDESVFGKKLEVVFPGLKGNSILALLRESWHSGKEVVACGVHSAPAVHGETTPLYDEYTYQPIVDKAGKVSCILQRVNKLNWRSHDAHSTAEKILLKDGESLHADAIKHLEQTIKANESLERNLRESERRLRSILETMAEGVGVTDAAGQMVYANPMAQRILGLKEKDIKKRTYDDPQWQNLRIDGTPLPSEEHPMSIMMQTQKPVTDHEIAVKPPDGDIIYLSINAAPMFDEKGVLTGGIGTFMDVTERRLVTQSKDDFISIASHELKTPVTALKGSLYMLQKKSMELSEEIKVKLVDQSVQSLNRLTVLIDELLDTRRLEKGHLKLDKKPFVLSDLFEQCRANFNHQLTRKITFGGDLHERVTADMQQIGQVMVNLINNAIKYAPESDIAIKANKLDEKEMMISVKDDGPGIPEQKRAQLFERYYRADYQGQKFSGLGLGLYICADIIKNHGGTIGVDSELGQGATFWFTLPF
ncbi:MULTISPECIES: PAS domain-containing sensor histidine kinase [unclassified Sphingobacterium]|uniref:PAS domain-containing sensor histidine kinase n=1 Tax=unclassified Sphingobacterium TaxID=2609468 RepID=UPI0025E7C73B|nr:MULTISPECIES: PAS domain-containing sensor histidine kinase [unclassified Sphingobacterium]